MRPRPDAASALDPESGFSLVEMLAAIAIFIVVLGATLTALETFVLGIERDQRRNDAQQQARTALDRMTRELRNLASPTAGQPRAVDEAGPHDLVFQTVKPAESGAGDNTANARRVRYCLDARHPEAGVIWMQEQTWTTSTTPPIPPTASCPDPDAGWTSREAVAGNIVNRINGQNRAIWGYDASSTADVSFIRTTVFVDREPGSAPAESTLSTGVFLRNQNRVPAAAFTATITGNGHVLLNGSPSADPEGQPLNYAWYDGPTQVGTGITYDYLAPTTGARSLSLTVSDPGGLQADAPPQTVTVQ